jgi:hypothetical protein
MSAMAWRASKGLSGNLNTGQGNGWDQHSRKRFEPCLVVRNLLGAAGRARAAHIMQFRPVGIEGPDEELAPEGEQPGEWAGASVAAVRRGVERGRSHGRHDESCLFSGGFCRAERFLGR